MGRAAGATVLILSTFLCACAGGAGPAGDAGVRGVVTLGPMCPVESVVSPCPDRPVAGVRVQALQGEEVVAETRTASDGTFRVALDPGDYVIRAIVEPGGPGMFAKPVAVQVPQHTFVNVSVLVDTGIRTPATG
jgi:hypothetical protein